jgi:uncharacterized membrane protein
MLGTLTQIIKETSLNYAKRTLLTVAVVVMLAVVVAADCARQTIHVGDRLYGGRMYSDFVSCGSSAGNFSYTCAEDGGCYENSSIDADLYCHCDDDMMLMQ